MKCMELVAALRVEGRPSVSYRQIDYWARQGWLGDGAAAQGSGSRRQLDREAVVRVVHIMRLREIGFTAEAAAVIAARPAVRDRETGAVSFLLGPRNSALLFLRAVNYPEEPC